MADTDAEERTYPSVREGMTIDDIAEYSGLSSDSIRHYHKQGQGGLPKPKATFGRTPVWERKAVDQWMANRRPRGRPRAR